jgi:hypothetical protein
VLGGAAPRLEGVARGHTRNGDAQQSDLGDDHRRRSHHYPYDASLNDVYARAKEQLNEAAREDFAAPGAIEDAVVVFARGQPRDLG